MNDKEILRRRINNFLDEAGVPKSAFCRRVGITASALIQWEKDIINFKPATIARIDAYLTKFNR